MTTDDGDADLLAALRAGDDDAYGVLFARHEAAARRFARRLVRDRATADEVVSEAFARVLRAIRNGNGPDVAFRPYLFVAVRSVASVAITERDHVHLTAEVDEAVDDADLMLEATDRSLIAQAYADLPERWRTVLWHLEVSGMSVSELAPILGMKPNAVSALAFRAREALRVSYLQAHLRASTLPGCARTSQRLARYVRGTLPATEVTEVEAHLATCATCRAATADLRDVATAFRAAAVPALLGVAGQRAWSARRRRASRGAAVAAAVVLLLALLATRGDEQPVADAAPSERPRTAASVPDRTTVPTTPPSDPPTTTSLATTTTSPPATSSPPSPTSVAGPRPGPTSPTPAPAPAPVAPTPAPGPPAPPQAVAVVRPIGSARLGAPAYVLVRVASRTDAPVEVRVGGVGTVVGPVSGRSACRGGAPMVCQVPVAGGVGEVVVRTGALDRVARLEVALGGATGPPAATLDLDPRSTGVAPAYVGDDGVAVAATGGNLRGQSCGAPGSVTGRLALPAGAQVRWARAYWSSSVDPGPARLRVPGGAVTQLRGDRLDRAEGVVRRSADVTGLVRSGGAYALEVDGVDGTWTLVVAHDGPAVAPTTVAVVYDALARVVATTRFGLAPAGTGATVGVAVLGGRADVGDDLLSFGGERRPGAFDSSSWSGGRAVTTCGLDLEVAAAAARTEATIDPGSERLVTSVSWTTRTP